MTDPIIQQYLVEINSAVIRGDLTAAQRLSAGLEQYEKRQVRPRGKLVPTNVWEEV